MGGWAGGRAGGPEERQKGFFAIVKHPKTNETQQRPDLSEVRAGALTTRHRPILVAVGDDGWLM